MCVWGGGGGGMGEGDLRPPSPVICKSHAVVRLTDYTCYQSLVPSVLF